MKEIFRSKLEKDGTLDLLFFFRYKHITSLKSHLPLAKKESLPYWFRGNFAGWFVLIYQLTEFPLSVVTNRFEMRYQLKQLLLLYT